jgi:ElaB/YqjD/DUF883 family membrane-anchored ribosome-binding protein
MTTRNLEGEFDVIKDDLVKLREDISKLTATFKEATSETVRDRVGALKGRIDEIAGDARTQSREAMHELADRIEERPLTSVLIAFGVGVLLGRLFDR